MQQSAKADAPMDRDLDQWLEVPVPLPFRLARQAGNVSQEMAHRQATRVAIRLFFFLLSFFSRRYFCASAGTRRGEDKRWLDTCAARRGLRRVCRRAENGTSTFRS